jgi:hypothetical protein
MGRVRRGRYFCATVRPIEAHHWIVEGEGDAPSPFGWIAPIKSTMPRHPCTVVVRQTYKRPQSPATSPVSLRVAARTDALLAKAVAPSWARPSTSCDFAMDRHLSGEKTGSRYDLTRAILVQGSRGSPIWTSHRSTCWGPGERPRFAEMILLPASFTFRRYAPLRLVHSHPSCFCR